MWSSMWRHHILDTRFPSQRSCLAAENKAQVKTHVEKCISLPWLQGTDMDLHVSSSNTEVDTQAQFDVLAHFCEESIVRKGFEEGIAAGEEIGSREGYTLGLSKGREIGTEIGFYLGFAKGWIANLQDPKEPNESLKNIASSCQGFLDPHTYAKVQEIIDVVEGFQEGLERNSKALKPLQKLVVLAESFPKENLKTEEFQQQLFAVRAKFKHCCSILKVENSQISANKTSF